MKDIITPWNRLLKNEKKKMHINDLDFSALSSWVLDCEKSFIEIYDVLLNNLKDIKQSDRDSLHEIVSDIYFNLDHIKSHIEASENGFQESKKSDFHF